MSVNARFFTKYLLLCLNILGAIIGVGVLIVGVKAIVGPPPYIDITNGYFVFLPDYIIFIIIGTCILLVSALGCCGITKENGCMVKTLSLFLLLVLCMEIVVGIISYTKYVELNYTVLNQTESLEQYNWNTGLQDYFNTVQSDLHCCGINGPEDWAKYNITVPETCCLTPVIKGDHYPSCTVSSANLFTEGCTEKLIEAYNEKILLYGIIGLVLAVIQIFGVIFACCFAHSIRNKYVTV